MNKEIFDEFIDNIYQICKLQVIKKYTELTYSENRILFILVKEKHKNFYLSDIDKYLDISRQRVNTILRSLNSKDYIVLEKSKKDKRKVIVKISSKGENYILKKAENLENDIQTFFSKLDKEQLIELNEILRKLIK